jgi:hypothetical protein
MADTAVEKLREALGEYDVRVEFSTALSIRGAHPCAIIYVRPSGFGKWKKADLPMILPPEGDETRSALLRLFADLLEPVGESAP